MAEPLDSVKKYIKVDTLDEEEMGTITILYSAAKALAEQTTGKVFAEEGAEPKDDLYRLAIWMLVSHWYDNRSAVVTGTIVTEVPFTAKMLMDHISLCGDYT